MAKFDADTLRELRDLRKVPIRTEKHPDSGVVIWVVVADDAVFEGLGDAPDAADVTTAFALLKSDQSSQLHANVVQDFGGNRGSGVTDRARQRVDAAHVTG
jgi:hypothetical protein